MIDVTPRRQKIGGKVPDHRWCGPRLQGNRQAITAKSAAA